MNIIYRISDAGYNKTKPDYINNENCLKNATEVFKDCAFNVIADNTSEATNKMIEKYVDRDMIDYVSVGHGAGTFNLALDKAMKLNDNEVVYFVENDYLHKPDSNKIIREGLEIEGVCFVSPYDHPDKYMLPAEGGNPFCKDGSEVTRVYLTENTHWKVTNSTTMTFAAKVKTLKANEKILRKHTSGTHPNDYKMFLRLRKKKQVLITPIPSYATHGETAWLAPLTNWEKVG